MASNFLKLNDDQIKLTAMTMHRNTIQNQNIGILPNNGLSKSYLLSQLECNISYYAIIRCLHGHPSWIKIPRCVHVMHTESFKSELIKEKQPDKLP